MNNLSMEKLQEGLKTVPKSELKMVQFSIKHGKHFNEIPVPIREFIDSDDYLGLKTQCRLRVKEEIVKIFGEEIHHYRLSKHMYGLITGSIGLGKSFTGGIVFAYLVYRLMCLKNPQAYYMFAKKTKLSFMNMSITSTNAKDVLFGEVKNRVESSPWFQKNALPDPRYKNILKFRNNVYVIPGDSAETTFEGYNILGGILDEGDSHKVTSKKSYAEQGFDTIDIRIKSRANPRFGHIGFLLVIGSKKKQKGFMQTKYDEFKIMDNAYATHLTIWDARNKEDFCGRYFHFHAYKKHVVAAPKGKNPAILRIPVEYRDDFIKNPDKSLRDLAGFPPHAMQPYFALSEKLLQLEYKSPMRNPVEKAVGAEVQFYPWFTGKSGAKYIAHFDLGLNKDGGDYCGFALGHISDWGKIDGEMKPMVCIDCMLRITAPAGGEVIIKDLRNIIYHLIDERNFKIWKISLDGWQCQIGSNKVKLLNGTSKRIDSLIKSDWIYSYDINKKRIVPAKFKPVKKTGIKKAVYKVTLDNGKTVGFTEEHPILMKDGKYKIVKELKVGDSLMPFYTKKINGNNIRKDKTKPQYEKILQPETHKWELTHDMVSRNVLGVKKKEIITHHKNFNSLDNCPNNLKYVQTKKHLAYHLKLATKARWCDKESREKQALLMIERNKKFNLPALLKPPTKKIAKKISKTIKYKWNNDSEYRKKMLNRPIYYGKKASGYKKEITDKIFFKTCNSVDMLKDVAITLKCSQSLIRRRLEKLNYDGWKEYKMKNNHRVVSIKFTGYEDVYDIEVSKYHNFALSAGLFVHNSTETIQQFRKRRIRSDVLSVDRSTAPYDDLKDLLYENRFFSHYYEPFVSEALELEHTDSGKVDHPSGGSKDVTDAVSAVVHQLVLRYKKGGNNLMNNPLGESRLITGQEKLYGEYKKISRHPDEDEV